MNNINYGAWLCSCGQENTGNFCMKCGSKRQFNAEGMSTSIGEVDYVSYDEYNNNSTSQKRIGILNILIGVFMVVALCCLGYIAYENGMRDYFSDDNTIHTQILNDKKIESSVNNTVTDSKLVDNKDVKVSEPDKVNEYVEARNPDGPNVYTGSNAQKSLAQYYQNITDKNMSGAYALLSPEMQNHMGAYEIFSGEYNDTLSSVAKNMTTLSTSNGYEEIEYYLEARDRINNSTKVKVSNFKGIAKMKVVNNVWVINELSVKQIGEHLE